MKTAKKKKQSSRKKSFIRKLGLFDRYNLAFILTSIIPLIILTFIVHKYVNPVLMQQHSDTIIRSLNILLIFLVFLAVLGFFVSRGATRESVEKLKEYNDRLAKLFDISQSLSKQAHLDILLENIVRAAIEMTGASGGIVLLRDDEKETLRFAVTIGVGSVNLKEIPLGAGIAGWVAENQELVLVNDVETDHRYQKDFNVFPNFNTSAILAVPLGISNRKFGVLELLHRGNENEFREEDARLLKSLAGQASIFIENVRFREEQQNYFIHITEILLNSLDGTRQFWHDHLKNTARYANMIGRQLSLSETEMKNLHYAALLHDIGFVKLDLKSKGATRRMIELHPELGYEMIYPISLWRDVAPLIRYHHERFDGNGYPHGIAGEEIPLGARILAVAEAFDTLTNPYSYRKEKVPPAQAFSMMKAYAGSHFDPRVIAALEHVMPSIETLFSQKN